ncbi:hybrid sensor histidine kinase/response regulator transcription factor [Arenibacter aquaticus]|nr:two-component regulator propeller domain-containing protein [Arenibacter aquaticus]
MEDVQNLSISEGLAHNGTTDILEDSRGFIWIGTYEGLNRYDGYTFETYKNTLDKNILASNRVRSIQEDSKGNIWIGTDEGISVYDYQYDNFFDVYSNQMATKALKGPVVRDITVNEELGLVICATEKYGLLAFNEDYELKEEYTPTAFYQNGAVEFYGSLQLDTYTYLYATSVGLLSLDLKEFVFTRLFSEKIDYCTSLLSLDASSFLVTLDAGAIIISQAKSANGYKYSVTGHTIFPELNFNSSILDQNKNLWLGTLTNGAIRIDDMDALGSNAIVDHTVFAYKDRQLRTSCFHLAKNSGFWLGSFDKGVYRFNLQESPFLEFAHDTPYNFGISNRHSIKLAPLDDYRFYVTRNNGGLVLFNTEKNGYDSLPFKMDPKLKSKISLVFVDSKKRTWLKVSGKGYFRVDPGSSEAILANAGRDSDLLDLEAYKITEDKSGNLWLGAKNGVFKINLDSKADIQNIESLNDNPFFKDFKLTLARYVYLDPLYDFLWIGTAEDGLFRVNIKGDPPLKDAEIEEFRAGKNSGDLPKNFVSAILRDNRGELWLGTEGAGICKVENSDATPRFIPFSEKDGLSNNVVKSINVDNQNNLWIATNIGLNKFYPDKQKFRIFGTEEGLPFEDFWYSSEHLGNGKLVLSGLEGFTFFDPTKIQESEKLPNLEFGDFKIYNRTVKPKDSVQGRVVLDKRLHNGQTLNLKYDENVFSVEATSLHYTSPENHFLKYRLIPIDQNWFQSTSDQRFINYNGLQPGNYTLEVSASNSIGEWTEPMKIRISIHPPFWKTPLAYVLYILLALLIVGIVLFYILKVQSLHHNIQLEQIEKDKVKEINAAKLRFFANISHELKTPLNLISAPIKELSSRLLNDPDSREKLGIVERQSKKIGQLIDQIHDFEKVDANLMEMEFSRFYFNEFLDQILVDFQYLAYNSEKKLTVVPPDNNIVVSADRDKLEKIFNNLLSNAFKYTAIYDNITIAYQCEDKDLIVSVTDTGRGIDADDLPHIFERYYQSKKIENVHSSGSGIGLAFSKKLVEMHYGYLEVTSKMGVGTTMQVRLPIVKKESLQDQASKENAIINAENAVAHSEATVLKTEISTIKTSGEHSESLIFYAEDDIDMRMYVSKVLSKFFKVKTFSNGKECLDAMDDQWPDLLISDIQMPLMNGLDLCKRIKADVKTSHIPVILLTALADIENQIQGIKDGADAYIKKPFDARQLVARTEALLTNKQRLRERFEIGIPLTKDNNINSRNDNAFLEKLYHLMAENLDNQNLDMDQFARKLYLNRTHFYQKVKALTNKTPFEMLKMYRLKRAAELLVQEPDVSVNDVYTMTGFKSRTHFSKLFKETYGVSPGKYVDSLDQ